MDMDGFMGMVRELSFFASVINSENGIESK